MSRCSKCGGNLVSSSETCISCGKPNPAFHPKVVSYSSPVVEAGVRSFRSIDPKIRMVTQPSGKGSILY